MSGDIDRWIRDLASDDGVVRGKAREELIAVGSRSVEPLIGEYSRGGRIRQWESAKALAEIADVRATPVLIDALENEDSGVRWIGAEGLAEIGEPAYRSLFEALRRSGEGNELSPWLREGARRVLKFTTASNPEARARVAPLIEALATRSSMVQIPVMVVQMEREFGYHD